MDSQIPTIEGESSVEEVTQGMADRLVAWGDPAHGTGDRPIQDHRVQPIGAADVPPHILSKVGGYGVEVNRRIAPGITRETHAAATDVVVAQDQLVRIQQPDAKRVSALHVVVGDPYRSSSERLAEDGLGARGRKPVAAEAQGSGRRRISEIDNDSVRTAVDR